MQRAGYISQNGGRMATVDIGPIIDLINANRQKAAQEQQDQQTVQVLTKLFPNMFAGKEVQNAPVPVQGEPTQMDSGNTFTPEYQVGLPATKTQPQIDPETFVRTPAGRAQAQTLIKNNFNPQNLNELTAFLYQTGDKEKAQEVYDLAAGLKSGGGQQRDFKAPEPKYRDKNTREPVGWDPTARKYVYIQRPAAKDGSLQVVPENAKFMPLAEKTIPTESENSINQGIDYLDNIDRIQSRLKPIFTGPIEGRAQKIKAYIASDPDYARLSQNVGQLVKIAYVLSGKQISEKEMEMLVNKITPQMENPDANFVAKLDELKTMVDRGLRYRTRALDEQGYIIPSDWGPFLSRSNSMVDRSGNKEIPEKAKAGSPGVIKGAHGSY